MWPFLFPNRSQHAARSARKIPRSFSCVSCVSWSNGLLRIPCLPRVPWAHGSDDWVPRFAFIRVDSRFNRFEENPALTSRATFGDRYQRFCGSGFMPRRFDLSGHPPSPSLSYGETSKAPPTFDPSIGFEPEGRTIVLMPFLVLSKRTGRKITIARKRTTLNQAHCGHVRPARADSQTQSHSRQPPWGVHRMGFATRPPGYRPGRHYNSVA
jgi:hypothetical protein